jgi:acetyl esterase
MPTLEMHPMRTATVVTVVLIGLMALDAPAQDIKPLTPVEAIKKVNEEVTVQMLVKAAKNRLEKRGEIYLDSEESFRDEKNLGIVITKTGAAKFMEAGVNDPAVHFQDKIIRVKGTVIIKEQRPRIEVDDPKDIQIVNQESTKTFTYTKTKQADLEIVVHFPPGWKETDKRPGIVFFFGGGWENGTIKAFEPQAKYLASRGMVTARADYRVKSRHSVTPKECVDDARSAVRWFRQNAAKLGVDPDRIVASGGSAGGHIAACTTLMPGSEAEKVSSQSNALTLFNPVLRFGPQLLKKIDNDEAVGKAISPILHLAKDSPPTLLFFGTDDFLYKQGQEFIQRSKELGHRSEMFTAEKQPHGFFHKTPWKEKTLLRTDEFLVSLGYLQGKPTIKVPDAKDAKPKDPPKDFTNSLGMKFVWIPPGTFMMGSPKEEKERDANEVQHKVTLTRGFYMGVYTVTQEQWQAVMGNNPSEFKGEKNLPVETVSWDDCQEFIKKLREKDKKPYRLPSEAEWEYACRAGTKTPFHFGQTISTDQANYQGIFTYGDGKKGVNRQKTTPVNSFPANSWGLHDMHGNVFQWCQDWFGDYPQNDVIDPEGPKKADFRVQRGGSWGLSPVHGRSASRGGSKPGDRGDGFGFRVCFFVE